MTTTTATVLWRDEVAIDMAADPLAVWALLSDIPRMGEWSPVCRRCEYLDGASSPTPGTRFVGHNRQAGARWSRTCVVTACEPGCELAFHTLFRGAPRYAVALSARAAGGWNPCRGVLRASCHARLGQRPPKAAG